MDLNTVFLVILTTARIMMPGMPSERIGRDGEVIKTPPPYTYDLSMALASTTTNKGRATVYVPAGVNKGQAVRLQVETEPAANIADIPADNAGSMKSYWGSAATIPEGQPYNGLTKGMTLSLPELPTSSYAYWPDLSKRNPPAPVSAAGRYKLYTDYCGHAFFDIPPTQDFLPAIDLHDLPAYTDLSKPLTLSWNPVPGAVAYFIVAEGGNPSENISWASSSTPDYPDGLDMKALTSSEIDTMIKKGILMSDKQTSCTIPADVFKGANSVVITMLAIGRDRLENINGIDVRILRRSLASVPVSLVTKQKKK